MTRNRHGPIWTRAAASWAVWFTMSKFDLANRLESLAANGWTLAGTATEQTASHKPPLWLPIRGGVHRQQHRPIPPVRPSIPRAQARWLWRQDRMEELRAGLTTPTMAHPAHTAGAPQVKRNGYPGLRRAQPRRADFCVSLPSLRSIAFRYSRKPSTREPPQRLADCQRCLRVCRSRHASVPRLEQCLPTWYLTVNTCIAPYTATTTTTTPFGVINSTSSILYGARQLQFAAKLVF